MKEQKTKPKGVKCKEFPCNIKRDLGDCRVGVMCLFLCEDYWSWKFRGFWMRKENVEEKETNKQ